MKAYFVEFIGTTFFMVVILGYGNPLAIGATLTILMYISNYLSFKNAFNPATAIGLYLKKILSLQDVILYSVIEILAVIFAYYLINLI